MKNPHLLTLVFLFSTFSLMSQSIERQLIGTAGENNSGKQVLLDWTLGETFIAYDNTLLGDYKEGFLQPYNLSQQLNESQAENHPIFSSTFSAEVFPNPFNGAFTFQVNQAQEQDAQLAILDYSGKTLMSKTFPAGNLKMVLAMNNYPTGLYFLQFSDASGIIKTSFKLLKL